MEKGERLSEPELTPYEQSFYDFNLANEVIKLRLIVRASNAPIHPPYILEKLNRIVDGIPISLDMGKQQEYNRIKRGYRDQG